MVYAIPSALFTLAFLLNYLFGLQASKSARIVYTALAGLFTLLAYNRVLIGDTPGYQEAWHAGEVDEFRSIFMVLLNNGFGFLDFVALNAIVGLAVMMLLVPLAKSIGQPGIENVFMAYFVSSFSFLLTIFELFKELMSLVFLLLMLIDLLNKKRRRAAFWALVAALAHPYSLISSVLIFVAERIPVAHRLGALTLWLLAVYAAKSALIMALLNSEFSALFEFYVEGSGNTYVLQPIQFSILIGSALWIYLREKRRKTPLSNAAFWCLFMNLTFFALSFDYPDMARRFIFRAEILTIPFVLVYLMSFRRARLLAVFALAVCFTALIMNPNLDLIAQF